MKTKRMPVHQRGSVPTRRFESRQEEALFWDEFDTAPYMPDDGEWFQFEVSARPDRCEHCGSAMQARSIDLHLVGHRITVHRVPFLVCPTCRRTRLPETIAQLASEIEASASRALTPATRTKEPVP